MYAQTTPAADPQQASACLLNTLPQVAPVMPATVMPAPVILPMPMMVPPASQFGMGVASGYVTQPVAQSEDPTASAVQSFTANEAASLGSIMASGAPDKEKKVHLRKGAGRIWSDPTLDEWPENDFRVFCGDLGNEVTDEVLSNAFRKYKSFEKARVVRDKRTGKTKGYGFVSFSDPNDMLKALKEMNFKYVGNRPIRVLRSKWKDREIDSERNKKFQEITVVQPANSKTLRKFKKLGVSINGGKMARQQQAAAVMGSKAKKTHAPATTYGRMTYQYIKGGHSIAPALSQGACAAPNLLDDI
ncbi:RNA recognition motif-containing protein [Besnoitia besnoiti]|uniref:RNA recognition motif-containing protein n=1 Tax=Besnoitia besnoiti TaxID=94643 RepID=A0A2A9MG46_BESBE|nr:RNA recognition motif-containing protein [Besnoitia besnoiti]PFH34577.1 RNA recognition motif-containing protein [Besnoitia besnoiti]